MTLAAIMLACGMIGFSFGLAVGLTMHIGGDECGPRDKSDRP